MDCFSSAQAYYVCRYIFFLLTKADKALGFDRLDIGTVPYLNLVFLQGDRDANLSRFQGSSSISSDMYFNRYRTGTVPYRTVGS